MIQLHLLGSTGLTDLNGREITTVLQQPKRLAVLTVLAAVTATRWHRRDTLLAMFWPDMDDERARAALRRTLTFLRTHVGEAVIQTRGDEVGIDPETLWCDVVACEAALREGRRVEAVELYRGDLLAGMHIPSAPEFERWLDGARERLRRSASEAVIALAADAERAGQLAEAAAWRRRALGIRPDDEASLRQLLLLLDRLGDVAGAVRAYDEFARRLAADLDLQPGTETQTVIRDLRTRARAAPVVSPSAPPTPEMIAVLPFAVRGPADVQYLREGLVDLLSTKLDGAGDLRTVDPGRVLARAGIVGTEPLDPGSARPLAEELGAGAFLLGSVVADDEHTLLRATLHEVLGAAEVRVDVEAKADASVFELVDSLVRQLLASRTQSLGGQLTRLGAVTTDSLPALRAYLDGERAYRRGRAHESRTAYAAAAERDPAFALAHYRLATAHAACGAPVAAVQAVERATDGARRLNPHTRMLLAAQAALLRGHLAEAERLCLRLLSDRPDDVEAWYRLARIQLDGNRFRGRPEAEARVALERTCTLDPRHAAARADLARLAWTTGDRGAARDHALRYLELSADGDDAAVMAVIGQAEGAADRLAAARPAAFHQVVALQILGAAFSLAAAPAASGPWASLLAAHAAAARRTGAKTWAALTRAAQFDPDLALDHEAFIAALPDGAPFIADTLVDRLRARDPDGTGTATNAAAAVRSITTHHSLGLLFATSGDGAQAAECARICGALEAPPWAASLPATLAAGIEARIALDGGDAGRALALVQDVDLGPWIHLADEIPQCGLVAERLLRAQALTALGRPDEARAWLTPSATLRPLEWAIGVARYGSTVNST